MVDSGTGDAGPELRPLPPDRYRDFARLGEGSMGVVYLALDTEMNRRVAFKMIRPHADPGDAPLDAPPTPDDASFDETQARFLQEAWVTGGLEHPGIVPVYELGRTTGGIPYYTMRRVRGERTLADAIDEAATLDARLALLEPFLRVCDTVRYAHAKGVIHRDLKPANIALGEFGETVVLDWGLAKLKDQPDLARPVWQERIEEFRDAADLHTLASAIGTPGYMAPEAALVQIDQVDARSDVYSLGAILYRILTGKPPFEFKSYGELVKKLTTGTPTEPVALDAAVPAGLARICMRALATERMARYADADAMAKAIRGWQRESAIDREVATLTREAETSLAAAPALAGDALLRQVDRVTAVCARVLDLRPGHAQAQVLQQQGRALREQAIAQRERGARTRLLKRVAVLGLAVATATTVVVAVLLNARRQEAEDARGREAVARTRAEEERGRAEDLSNFMLFDLRDGLEPIGRLDLLDKVARKAREYYESLPEKGVTWTVLRRRKVALTNVGDVLQAQGRLDEALVTYQRALALNEKLAAEKPEHGPLQQDLCACLTRIGTVFRARGELDKALAYHSRAIAIDRRLMKREPQNTAWRRDLFASLCNVGHVLKEKGDAKDSLAAYQEATDLARGLIEEEPSNAQWSRDLCSALTGVAGNLSVQGDRETAQRRHEEALTVIRRLLEEDPTHVGNLSTEALILRNLGEALSARGQKARALQYYRESAAALRRLSEMDPSNTGHWYDLADVLAKLGDLHVTARRWQAAEKPLAEALKIQERLCAIDPSNADWRLDLCRHLCRVGDCRLAARDLAEAEEYYRAARALTRKIPKQAEEDPRWQMISLIAVAKVGDLLDAKGDADGALECQREALSLSRRHAALRPDDLGARRTLAVSLNRLGDRLNRQGASAEALTLQQEALTVWKALVARDPANARGFCDLAITYQQVAHTLRRLDRLDDAVRNLEASAEILRSLMKKHPGVVAFLDPLGSTLYWLGRLHETQGDYEASLRALEEAERAFREAAERSPRIEGRHRTIQKRRRRAELLAGKRAPAGAGDHLLLAGAHYDGRRYLDSARHYEAALKDAKIRGNLGDSHLYNAACSAALAAAKLEGDEAAKLKKQALAWLAEDLRRRVESGEDEARLRAHLEHARVKDTDLASLRGMPEFEALFVERPRD